MNLKQRVVITGIGLTAPNGNSLNEFRQNLLAGKSGLTHAEIRFMGKQVAGLCRFDETKYHSKKNRRRGTRAGSISIYCAHEALIDSKIDLKNYPTNRIGVFIGITEHGNVETENEVYELYQNKLDTIIRALNYIKPENTIAQLSGAPDVPSALKNADIVIVTNEDPYDDNPQEIIHQVADGAMAAGKVIKKNFLTFFMNIIKNKKPSLVLYIC